MRNVRIRIAYDGSKFYGWQRQAGFESVQEALEVALQMLSQNPVVVHGAGRTDSGVHARGQVASFHIETRLSDERLLFAFNHHLPAGVVVRDLETCADDFHAQYCARGKRYLYLVRTTRFPPPYGRQHCFWLPDALDLVAMRRAAAQLCGEHDFSAFACSGSKRQSNVRRIDSIHIPAKRDVLAFAVQGNGFLYNMVRIIAGTLLEVGREKRAPEGLPELLASRDRRRAGPTAPPGGLYLASVLYPERVFALRGRSRGRRRPGVFNPPRA